jgi:tetratricopeptide (TPR) repeat protein
VSEHALGKLAFQQGDTSEAMKHYKKAMEMYAKLGVTTSDAVKASGPANDAYWANVRDTHPSFMDTPNGLGNCAMRMGDYAGAEDYYAVALKANPGDPTAVTNFVTAMQAQSKFDDALEYIEPFIVEFTSAALGLVEQPLGTKAWNAVDKAKAHAKVWA